MYKARALESEMVWSLGVVKIIEINDSQHHLSQALLISFAFPGGSRRFRGGPEAN